MRDNAVLIFAKAPVAGRVKTRLIPRLGEDAATRLYRWMLQRELGWISADTPYDVELWVTPETSHPLLQSLALRHRLPLLLQQGDDLGARMAHAARQALARYRRVVLIGVDCPALTAGHLHESFDWLAGGMDAVMGPAEDGGYVLLGLNRWDARLFEGHAWGGADVAESTRRTFRDLAWHWRELAPLWDIDRPEDLLRLERFFNETGDEREVEALLLTAEADQALPRDLEGLVGRDSPERP